MIVNVSESPIAMVVVDLLSAIAVTGIGMGGAVTVTLHVAVLLPSAVVTVIVVFPGATAETLPSWSTVAISGLLVDHETALLSALLGCTVAVNCSI